MPEFPLSNEGPDAAGSARTGAGVLMITAGLWAVTIIGFPLIGPLAIVLGIAAIAGTIAGCWKLTAAFGRAPRTRSMIAARVGPVGLAATLVCAPGLEIAPGWIVIALLTCLVGFSATTVIALGMVCTHLAARIPSHRAIRSTRRYRRWAAILSIASAVAPFAVWGLFKTFEAGSGPPTGYDELGWFLGAVAIVGLPLVIITIVTVVMFFIAMTGLRRALKPLIES
ncbi:MAG: hypothetical protein AAGF47_04730 [Planctomycetota bacterium]